MAFSKEEFYKVISKWSGVPYLHAGNSISAGVDCVNFLICVYEDLGILKRNEIKYAPYPPDWHLHQTEERLLNVVNKYCFEIPKNFLVYSDIVLMKFGHCFSHGAIYLENNQIIHSVINKGVINSNLSHRYWAKPDKKYFRLLRN